MFYGLHFCAAIIMTHPAINNKYKKESMREKKTGE